MPLPDHRLARTGDTVSDEHDVERLDLERVQAIEGELARVQEEVYPDFLEHVRASRAIMRTCGEQGILDGISAGGVR